MKRIIPYLFLLTAIISGYTCRSGDQSPVKSEITQVLDSSYLFDGKTLDGWEITDLLGAGFVSVAKCWNGDGNGHNLKRDFPTVDYEVTLEAMRWMAMTFLWNDIPVGKDPHPDC
jgi:hypothetical protein